MGEKQGITVRLSEEAYSRVKKYADEVGESMNGAVCRIIDEFFKGAVPAPAPAPPPGHQSEIPEELLGVPARVRRLEAENETIKGYVNGLSERVEEYNRQVNRLLGVVSAPMPHIPTPEEWMQKFTGRSGGKAEE